MTKFTALIMAGNILFRYQKRADAKLVKVKVKSYHLDLAVSKTSNFITSKKIKISPNIE